MSANDDEIGFMSFGHFGDFVSWVAGAGMDLHPAVFESAPYTGLQGFLEPVQLPSEVVIAAERTGVVVDDAYGMDRRPANALASSLGVGNDLVGHGREVDGEEDRVRVAHNSTQSSKSNACSGPGLWTWARISLRDCHDLAVK